MSLEVVSAKRLQELIAESIGVIQGFFEVNNVIKELEQLDNKIQSQDLWSDAKVASSLLKRRSVLSEYVNNYKSIVDEFQVLVELANESGEDEVDTKIYEELHRIQKFARDIEIATLFREEQDYGSCILELHSGAGGTESDDWAEMLLRMYSRWAENKHYSITVSYMLHGEEAGIKSATLKIEGKMVYGLLKTESGIHRLVRISPFNKERKRHTSFASVSVVPLVDDDFSIDINESDLRIDTYRSSGAGGQHVNTTDSAVRVVHIPSGITVQCQNNRSQHKNKEECMRMLRSKLYALELKRRNEAKSNMEGEKLQIGWGSQIRSYVLHPYQMVKDLRTNYSEGNAQKVLDGDIDDFIKHTLRYTLSNEEG
nr:peptide chain release factor 2 [Candidatus Fokinia cryptica]